MISVKLPTSRFYRPAAGVFTATFNAPSVGQYDWNVAANTEAELLSLNANSLYLISSLNFSATISESNYLENIDEIPSLDLRLKLAGGQLNGQGYPLVTYMQNNEIAIFFWTQQPGDFLTGTFRGVLNQNAALAATPSITAQVSINIHEITDQDFINAFHNLVGGAEEKNFIEVPAVWKDRI